MKNDDLAYLQQQIVQEIIQASYKPLQKHSIVTQTIDSKFINMFGLFVKQKRIENLKHLLPHTMHYLKQLRILTDISKSYLKNHPPRKLDYFTNALEFHQCLSNYKFNHPELQDKVMDLANYEIAIAKALHASDHNLKQQKQCHRNITYGMTFYFDPSLKIVNLNYDIKPLLKNKRNYQLLKTDFLKLLVCWDYRNNYLRVFELDQLNYQLLTDFNQMSLYLKFVGITHFLKQLININVLEIKS